MRGSVVNKVCSSNWADPYQFHHASHASVGTLEPNGARLPITLADHTGAMVGGHRCAGSLVSTTADMVIGLLPQWRFNRAPDPATGGAKLQIQPRQR